MLCFLAYHVMLAEHVFLRNLKFSVWCPARSDIVGVVDNYVHC